MGNLPNNNWGYGKINAYRTLKGFYPGYYAGVRTLSGTDMNLAIFPNPTSGNSFLSFESQGHNAIHLKLYDCLGILHWQREIQTEKGLNRLELPTETLSGGSYFLQLHSESGNWMMKLVKE